MVRSINVKVFIGNKVFFASDEQNCNANFLLVINTITLFCVSVAFSVLPLLTFDLHLYILNSKHIF